MLRGARAEQVAAALAGYDLLISPASRSPSSIRRSARRWSRSRMRCAGTAGGWRSTATTARRLARPRCGARRVRPDARAGRHRPADARRRAGPVRREGCPESAERRLSMASPRSRSLGQAGCPVLGTVHRRDPAEPVGVVVDSTAADSFNARPRGAPARRRSARGRPPRQPPAARHRLPCAIILAAAMTDIRLEDRQAPSVRRPTSRRCCARTPGRRARPRSTGRRLPVRAPVRRPISWNASMLPPAISSSASLIRKNGLAAITRGRPRTAAGRSRPRARSRPTPRAA